MLSQCCLCTLALPVLHVESLGSKSWMCATIYSGLRTASGVKVCAWLAPLMMNSGTSWLLKFFSALKSHKSKRLTAHCCISQSSPEEQNQ